MRRTKIICTIGPASQAEDTLREMIHAGMNVARLNFSHGTHEGHHKIIEAVKKVRKEEGRPIGIMLDTKGPEIRTKDFACEEGVILEKGDPFTLTGREVTGTKEIVSVSFPALADNLKAGDSVLIDDGKVALRVRSIEGRDILCEVAEGGRVKGHKGVNVPHVHIDMPFISEADRADLLFGIREEVDFIAASFVRTEEDVELLRAFLKENGGENIKIIAKIENEEGVNHMDAIVRAADGVMVARGDMGVEIEFARLPGIQKRIIRSCLEEGKISVTATQMLETMIENVTPTRAEISDVANAVFDGTSAIMLSGETAMGKHPVHVVRTMAGIARQAETDMILSGSLPIAIRSKGGKDSTYAISDAAATTAYDLKAKAILALTRSGKTARNVSRFRPTQMIIAPTPELETYYQLSMSWGVYPLLSENRTHVSEMFAHGVECALENRFVQSGDVVVITSGVPGDGDGMSNMLKIEIVK